MPSPPSPRVDESAAATPAFATRNRLRFVTAASLFEASGWPVAVAFDAGNLQPVAEAIARRYRGIRLLIVAGLPAFIAEAKFSGDALECIADAPS